MPSRIEDYAVVGDMESAGLVGRDGSIDWLCVPRFDSPAIFAALLGDANNGCWRIAPVGAEHATRRRYRDDTLILEHEWETETGVVRLTDFMPARDQVPNVVRIVEGVSGEVDIRSELRLRFDYGQTLPWVRHVDGHVTAVAGPDAVDVWSDVEMHGRDNATWADFTVRAGDRKRFVLTWHASHRPSPDRIDELAALERTEAFWTEWISRMTYDGPYRDAVARSLITLKALTYEPTGGIVAAVTTSLPEDLGGERNWDYRFCWLRDAALTLRALVTTGYTEEAADWREWLLRAVAGDPADLQIMYGLAGERRLTEYVADWLPGYEGSAPVRIGNAASQQRQLDVYGEVIDAWSLARRSGMPPSRDAWNVELALLGWLEKHWDEADEGLWEVRGPRRRFTHSKVLEWVAFDRAIRATRITPDLPAPVERWKAIRDRIHEEVCNQGFDADRNTFVQAFGGHQLDAATLLIPMLGFLPGSDPRVQGTVDAIQKELMAGGFVRRYDTSETSDGLAGSEGAFLACSFWLADALHLCGRTDEATDLFERLLGLRNDVGLLAEEYDPRYGRQVGNFPQAFSHIALVNTAVGLSQPPGEAPFHGDA